MVPLRIPSGWIVLFNIFFEIDPVIVDKEFVHAEYFTEDLLRIERYFPEGAKWEHYVLDLGWFPAEEADGTYYLTLEDVRTSEILRTYETKEREKVREVIERWLEILSIHGHESIED